MDFLERDLEDILCKTPQGYITSRGLGCFDHTQLYRQVRLPPYGIIDLIGIKYYPRGKMLIIRIYELKNKVLNAATFWQTLRYIKAVQQATSYYILHNHIVEIRGTMIGREVSTDGEFCYLPALNSNIDIYTYSYDYDGVSFKYIDDLYYMKGFNGINLSESQYSSPFQFAKQILTKPKILE